MLERGTCVGGGVSVAELPGEEDKTEGSPPSAAITTMIEEDKLACTACPKTFTTAKLLAQHQQMFHTDKAFVCEICNKAFRFRSNLAEHRSVHTALKPYVCKFCGKSSRLKGNLTKHILKHHKSEQSDNIGKDDIIVKKEASSVQSEILEKIVLATQANSGQSLGDISFSLRPKEEKADPEYERAIFISFGLDQSSMDLTSREGVESTPEQDISENGTEFANGSNIDCGESDHSASPLPLHTVGGSSSLQALFASVTTSKTSTPGSAIAGSSGRGTPIKAASSSGSSSRTQCIECGKHFRKVSALQLHMTLNHGLPPPGSATSTVEQKPSQSNDEAMMVDEDVGSSSSIPVELRAIKGILAEVLAEQRDHKLDQLVASLDSRVSRLEKNVETVLNSMYSLVQLQTGLNSSVARLREESIEHLRVIRASLESQSGVSS